jgi:two-component system LytT family sensor kinase
LSIGELLNVIGLSMGVVLYAMLLAMVVRAGRRHDGDRQFDPLLVVTAVLGLVWNLCALPTYELPKVGIAGPFPVLTAVGFGALGFLPAVVVHSVLRGDQRAARGRGSQSLAAVAYVISAAAVVLHLRAALTGGPVPSPLGMRLLTYTFVALIVPLAAVTRRQPGSRRALWAAALATFAVSALHLSQLHRGDAAWPIELLGHHASLPLAVAILYQDYPFAFADLFLKRMLSLLAIVALVFGTIATFGAHSQAFAQFAQHPRQISLLTTLWLATILLFPILRHGIVWFVDTVVLRRPDYGTLSTRITRTAQRQHDVPALLLEVCTLLAPALTAQSVTWREWWVRGGEEPLSPSVVKGREAAALAHAAHPSAHGESAPPHATELVVTVPASEAPQYVIAIAGLMGGRRFFSDDFAALQAIALVVARRIDAIRLADERYERELREREIGKLATEAELRALRAQVNPHFLFNALTTLGYLIQTAPSRALETLFRLTALLRGVLRSEGELTTLGRELELVEAYLDIERARFEERLSVTIDVPAAARHVYVPTLVLQPLVENAVKHGIATKPAGGGVTIRARIDRFPDGTETLVLTVRDAGVGATSEAIVEGRRRGVGLDNIARRLTCQYGAAASLTIQSALGEGTTAVLRLPARTTVDDGVIVEPASR